LEESGQEGEGFFEAGRGLGRDNGVFEERGTLCRYGRGWRILVEMREDEGSAGAYSLGTSRVEGAQKKGEVGGLDGVGGRLCQTGEKRLEGSFGWDR
jgi:hypothetical protein